ncbi:unnamed protein product [Amoebophrya sp. A120]|nr:unnamed protein product [Amoebophrya sp. A120]|eukprot:GSA120T00016150001.1
MKKLAKAGDLPSWMVDAFDAYTKAYKKFENFGFRTNGKSNEIDCPKDFNPLETEKHIRVTKRKDFPSKDWRDALKNKTKPMVLEMPYVNRKALDERTCDDVDPPQREPGIFAARSHAPPEFVAVSLGDGTSRSTGSSGAGSGSSTTPTPRPATTMFFRKDNLCHLRDEHCIVDENTDSDAATVIRQEFLADWGVKNKGPKNVQKSRRFFGFRGTNSQDTPEQEQGETSVRRGASGEEKTELWFVPKQHSWYLCEKSSQKCVPEAVVSQPIDRSDLTPEEEFESKKAKDTVCLRLDSFQTMRDYATDGTTNALTGKTIAETYQPVCLPKHAVHVLRTVDPTIAEGSAVEVRLLPGEPRAQGFVTKLWKPIAEQDDENDTDETSVQVVSTENLSPAELEKLENDLNSRPLTTSDDQHDCNTEGCVKVMFTDPELNQSPDRIFSLNQVKKATRVVEDRVGIVFLLGMEMLAGMRKMFVLGRSCEKGSRHAATTDVFRREKPQHHGSSLQNMKRTKSAHKGVRLHHLHQKQDCQMFL